MKKALAGITLGAILCSSFGGVFAGAKSTSYFKKGLGGTEHSGVVLENGCCSASHGIYVEAKTYKKKTKSQIGQTAWKKSGSKSYYDKQEYSVNKWHLLGEYGYHYWKITYLEDTNEHTKTNSGYDY